MSRETVPDHGAVRGFFMDLTPQRAFVLLGVLGSICLMCWAGFTKIDVIVRTEGKIIPAGKSQIVQHLEGGIVTKILVQEGQVVSTDEPLMELSNIQARSTLDQEQTKLSSLRGREARLIAEVSGSDAILFPPDMNDANVISVETSAWMARRRQQEEEISVLRSQSLQKHGELTEIISKHQNLRSELELLSKQLKVIEGLKKNNAASELEVLEIQSRIQRLNSQIAEASTAIPRLRAAQSEVESRINEGKARFRAEASSALTQVREELERSGHEIGTNVDRVDRNIVRAPVSGFINKLNVTTIGGVVRPSEVLLEITPNDQRIIIETRANPNDRAKLRSGLSTRVRIGAYDYATYGTLDGHVTEVSADTITDERGVRYYRVNIEVDMETVATSIRQPGNLIPGMAASADVVVGKRTILSYLLSPLLKFRDGAFRA